MRLLKRHHDEADTPADTDDAGTDATAADVDETRPPATEPTPAATEEETRRGWRRRTVTVPVTVPRRAVRRTVELPPRSVDRIPTRHRLTPAPVLAVGTGAALAVVGLVAVLRAGINETWFRPTVEVLNADHTALLATLEVGAGLLLIAAGLTGSRVLVAVLGLALALGATAVAVDPVEVQRELAVEQWWAWVLVAAGVVLTLAALQAPVARARTRVDVT